MTSPSNLLQEQYRKEPWKMMVLCIMLNQTHYKQVYKVKDEFFRRWPSPEKAIQADPGQMKKLLKPLGFSNRRYITIWKFSRQYQTGAWTSIDELYGIGKYGKHSWMIFLENKIPSDVTDKKLKEYLEWKSTLTSTQQLQSIK